MPYRRGRPHPFTLSIQFLAFGLWIATVGLAVLFLSAQSVSALSGLGAATGTPAAEVPLVEGVALLYRGGFATLGLGALMMAFGGTLVVSVVR